MGSAPLLRQRFGVKEGQPTRPAKEELRQEVLHSRAGVHAEAHPLSPYVPEDPPEGEAGEERANDDAAEEEEDS